MTIRLLEIGDVVQITDERDGLVGAFLIVEEVKSWGVQGFVHHVKSFDEAARMYLRLEFGRFEYIGHAVMLPESLISEHEEEQ